ncbi:uncharacterized protein FSUBG_11923 [Fusarium subglutinans]|uniref:Uncharacterized protein n=1 Tax=Gibberella subglutinans TaxID=42677 RepID=A0A8H5L8L2_GIBSU|nr:uncharacterized protein FSUBG_11923 [Fusarium subglutinans]KAF5586993.1 hypothetical protein FSUBG_11923 [Fusarium subglutinans]
MSTTYTIILQNDHQVPNSYAIFNAPPKVSSSGVDPQVYTNAWMTQYVGVNGNMTVRTSVDFYAWTGTTPSSPAPGVVVQTGTSQLVQLGTTDSPGSTIPMSVVKGTPTFGTPTMTSKPGAYEIDTDSSFATPNRTYMIGLGKVDSFGIVSPVATMLADNNTATTVTPIMKFYVGAFSFQPGTIVNFSTVTLNSGTVDFSSGPGLGMSTAVVRHDQFGKFTTSYYPNAAAAALMRSLRDNQLTSFITGGDKKSNEKQQELESLIMLSDSQSDASVTAGEWAWLGKVGWPSNTSVAVVTAGAVFIAGYLAAKGYRIHRVQVRLADGTIVEQFYFGPGAGALAEFEANTVQSDWKEAVTADRQSDGHFDMGLQKLSQTSNTGGGSIDTRSLEKLFNALNKKLGNAQGNGPDNSNGLSNSNGNGYTNDFGNQVQHSIAAGGN